MSKTENNNKDFYRKNLQFTVYETILTSIGASFAVSTITIFYNSIGMNQTDIGFVQMIFTIIICIFDIPMGYIADRFNRKLLNIIGDIGVAFIFILYALAQNMYMAILAECLLGIFMAMTNGVDQGFIKYNCNKIDKTGKLFKKTNVQVHTARYIALFLSTIIGGLIAKYSLRLTLAITFIPYFIGGLIAFKIEDFNEKIEAKHKNPIKDMIITVEEIIKNKKTKTYLIAYIISKEVTHSQIWILTPLLISVGVPIEIVSSGWIINYLMQILGGKLSEKMINFKPSKKFAIPVAIELSWLLILFIKTNIFTVWLFTLNGFIHGLLEGNLSTSVQESTRNELQTSVMSLASTGARLLYIPLVYIINYLGNMRLQLGLIGVCIVFLPISILIYTKLKKLEK